MAIVTVNDTPIRYEDSAIAGLRDLVPAIHGSGDQAISLDRARLFIDAVLDSRGMVVVDGAAHAPNMSHPEIVNEALTGFLATL